VPKVIKVIESDKEMIGQGIAGDPDRHPLRYYGLDGSFLAERDELLDMRIAHLRHLVTTKTQRYVSFVGAVNYAIKLLEEEKKDGHE